MCDGIDLLSVKDTIDTACACALENLFLIRQPTKKAIDGQSTGFPPK